MMQEWKDLATKIREYNTAYEKGEPIVSDNEYDHIKARLLKIEKIIGKQPKSPLYEVGSTSASNKVSHRYPMLSLDHGFGIQAIHTFHKRLSNLDCTIFPLIAEYKIDGIALSLRYNENRMIAITRGDGKKGSNITKQIDFLKIPKVLNDSVEIRGELYMTFDEFFKLKNKFSSPRNACAALIQSKVSMLSLNVNFFAYQIFGEHATYLEKLKHLEDLDFETPIKKVCNTIEECVEFFQQTEEKRNNNLLSFPIDGIVLKINHVRDWDKLGHNTTGPRYACAVKFNPHSAETIINNIVPQVGKFGIITPVAIFNPVKIGGSVITRATLHNLKEVKEKNYGIGDKIFVSKAGDTVPYIKEKTYNAPGKFEIMLCPSCNTLLTEFEKTLKCNNSWFCEEQKIGRIKHFCSRNAFNISSLGGKTVETFVKAGYLQTPADIFILEEKIRTKIINLKEGWKEKSIQNLINGINNAKKVQLSNFLFSLGIPNLGLGQASLIAAHIANFTEFIQTYKSGSNLSLRGVGDVLNTSIYSFLNNNLENWIYNLEPNGVKTVKE